MYRIQKKNHSWRHVVVESFEEIVQYILEKFNLMQPVVDSSTKSWACYRTKYFFISTSPKPKLIPNWDQRKYGNILEKNMVIVRFWRVSIKQLDENQRSNHQEILTWENY